MHLRRFSLTDLESGLAINLTTPENEIRAKALKMLILDVDGVLTDGTIILSDSGDEVKHFHVQDGMGITLAQAAGLRVGILTGRSSKVVERRAKELKIEDVVQGSGNKGQDLDVLLAKYSISCDEIAYIGDDIPDLPVMRRVSMPIAVANARPEVKEACIHVTTERGGNGAVREAIDWLLELRGQKHDIYEQFALGER